MDATFMDATFMNADQPDTRELTIPANALTLLRTSLRKEAGALGATHALHAAGYGAGGFFQSLLGRRLAGGSEMEQGAYWQALDDFFSDRGWGSLRHEAVHPGLGLLASSDWAEASGDGQDRQPSCAFTSGVLSYLLTEMARGPMAVLEVACRSRGDDECHFVFGSESAIHELYGLLLDERSFDEALASL